ncbi:hypothetical protein BX600DRAFT_509743 [Xylariales sp. PMI_506]|nr:hypothetical protein BX600DRAFT_509743 [Xylariales sp. PMI_506]
MHTAVLLYLTGAAALAAGQPLEAADTKALWSFSLFDHPVCSGQPDVVMTSDTPNSRCMKYNNGIGKEVDSITFMSPRNGPDCQYGCERCKIHIYYSPKGEKADCCDKHKVPWDWSKKDAGKCIDIRPPESSRVRYRVDCE